ncbi:MAG TPA: sulfite exporter TauE/SafE family protein [Pirellulales bacterium]|jgi:hypothetical protein
MLLDNALLCLSAVLAGAMNAIAGGGTLVTFPALYAILGTSGEAARIANCTNTVALLPGALAAAWGYRRELSASRRWMVWLAAPSILGGLIGSLLLTEFSPDTFKKLVPWLILTAALLFAIQPYVARWTGIGKPHATPTRQTIAAIISFHFLVSVYGGYFGAGIGILMLSALAMMGLSDIHVMNGLKTVLNALINGVSAVWFIWKQDVNWHYALMMMVAAIIGGYFGAHVARRLDKNVVRRIVVVIGFSLAAYEFYRQVKGA